MFDHFCTMFLLRFHTRHVPCCCSWRCIRYNLEALQVEKKQQLTVAKDSNLADFHMGSPNSMFTLAFKKCTSDRWLPAFAARASSGGIFGCLTSISVVTWMFGRQNMQLLPFAILTLMADVWMDVNGEKTKLAAPRCKKIEKNLSSFVRIALGTQDLDKKKSLRPYLTGQSQGRL